MNMKKNITINLFGSLYSIDEDAYELLNQYQNNMRRYFSRQEGGEEIAEDIERRVAELFAELKTSGVEAITIEQVQDIIDRIGNPEEVDGDTPENEDNQERHTENETVQKKLFRNPDDKMLGGVTSGLACYFGIDALWLRLLMILFAWFSVGTMILIYLVLWVVIPEARTPEDRLRMQGKAVNMKNLRDEIVDKVRQTGRYAAMPETRKTAKSLLNGIFKICIALVKGCFILLAACLLIFCAVKLIGLLVAICGYIFASQSSLFESLNDFSFLTNFINGNISQGIYWVALVSFLFLLVLTLCIGIHAFARMMGYARPMSVSQRLTLIVLWVILAIVCTASLIQGGMQYRQYKEDYYKQEAVRHNELYYQQQLDYLKQEGWKVVRQESCGGHYMKSGEHYSGDRQLQYFDAWSKNPNMAFEMERTVKVAPGTYTLEAMARTDGKGCYIFANAGNGSQLAAVPVYGNTGGGLWQEANQREEKNDTIMGMWASIQKANSGKGYGWSRVTIENITVGKDSTVHYGVTNTRGDRWEGTWLSATDFKLQPERNAPKRIQKATRKKAS